jgi:hypothetical protein
LPAAIAADLAARSDRVAAALAAGDTCAAAAQAGQLRGRVVAAINAGRVPAPLQEDVAGAANSLVERIRCVPPPPPPPPPPVAPQPAGEQQQGQQDGKRKHKRWKAKHRKHRGQGDGGNGEE